MSAFASWQHLEHFFRLEAFQKLPRVAEMEFWIAGFNRQKKAVSAGADKLGHIEHGMVGHWQAIQGEHAKQGGERRAQHRQLESDRNKGRPTMQRPAADVDRVADYRRIIQHVVRSAPSQQAADQRYQRQPSAPEAKRLRQTVQRERRITVDSPKARF